MTTVAYRDGVLAADSRMTANGWIVPDEARKIRRISDGSVCAVTGNLAAAIRFVDWLDAGRIGERPPLADSRVVRMNLTDTLTIYEGEGEFTVTPAFTAFGTGMPAAIAAMHMGADARRAVEIAALVDADTGGPVIAISREA